MLDARYWILDSGYSMLDTGCSILDAGYWILDSGYSFALTLRLAPQGHFLRVVYGTFYLDIGVNFYEIV